MNFKETGYEDVALIQWKRERKNDMQNLGRGHPVVFKYINTIFMCSLTQHLMSNIYWLPVSVN
jgi:hypothetical protein